MGLQVWLPLIKDVRNYGLSNLTFINNGATVNDSGKIGSCYSFNGSSYLESSTNIGNGVTNWTISCWINPDATTLTSGQWYRIGGIGSHNRVHLDVTSENKVRCFVSFDGTTGTNVLGVVSNIVLKTGTWYHVCGTVDDTSIKIYMNGILERTIAINKTYSSTSSGIVRVASVNNGNNFYGKINDFRIYDHCLSPREIKEISKGLVLHYPLSRGGFGQDNLIHDTANMSNTIWSYGSHASAISDENGKSVLLTGTDADWGSRIGSSYNISNTSYFIPYSLIQNKQVTFSLWIKGNQNFNQSIIFSLRTSNSASRTKYFTGGIVSVSTEWQRKSFTLTVTDSRFTSGSGTISTTDYFFVEIYNHVNNRNVWVRGLKLEYGDKVTPWTPNPADEIYSTMGLNDGIEYDVSGYERNGVKTNITYSSDTARYNTSSVFNGTSSKITTFKPDFIKDEVTFSFWAYMDNWGNGALHSPVSAVEGGGFGMQGNNTAFNLQVGTGSSSVTWIAYTANGSTLNSGWHHFAGTYDGFVFNAYIDGTQVYTDTKYTTKTPIFYNTNANSGWLFIGGESGGSATNPSNYFNGKISDVRIYSTALSADDILELYHTPISLSHNGTLLTQGEYVES